MARKNRVSVRNGTFHVSSRIANASALLKNDCVKERIVNWIYDIAEFTGVRILSWCILDNHFHLFLHVPPVPKEYWADKNREPEAYAYGMRPPECEGPLWTPPGIDKYNMPVPLRTEIGIAMSDEELLRRIKKLDGSEDRAEKLRKKWERLRKKGNDKAVEAEKEHFFRRMYNLSHYVKTFKERIAYAVRTTTKHTGHVFEGRFFSGLVENDELAKKLVSLYVDYNPYKNGKVDAGEAYRWSSFGQALKGGPRSMECRYAIEEIWGMSYPNALKEISEIFSQADKTGNHANDEFADGNSSGKNGEKTPNKLPFRMLISMRVYEISRGAYIGRTTEFIEEVVKTLPIDFPSPSPLAFFNLQEKVDWSSYKRTCA